MNIKTYLILFILLIIGVGNAMGDTWETNTGIKNGLTDIGDYSRPTVFYKDSTWYLISGELNGVFYGYNWTGSVWQSDTGIISGLNDIGWDSSPNVFYMDSIWYLVCGDSGGNYVGFNWTGSTWQSDTGIISGLVNVGFYATPNAFCMDSTCYLISGNGEDKGAGTGGQFFGYNWTGSAWQVDNAIISGLTDTGTFSAPNVFYKNNTWCLISGQADGGFTGFNWTGSVWQSDINITTGLDTTPYESCPSVFKKDDIWYLITGNSNGGFSGYKGSYESSIPDEPEDPGHNYTQHFNNLYADVSVWALLSAIFGTYETICTTTLFWLIIIMIPFTMTWIKQQSVIIPSILALICGSTLFILLPQEATGAIKMLLIIGISGILYHIIKSR